jgi:5-oxoprolinase (ATP-hydrolysing) subunit A
MMKLNLNADLGESFGAWHMGADDAMLDIVNSANVACGFHAGDPSVMRRTLALARERGVSVGAHPAFHDLQGFGRRRIEMGAAEVQAILLYQIGALQALAKAERMEVTHVKPHGALNNMACEDRRLADAIAQTVRLLDPQLALLAPALSELTAAGRAAGLRVVDEVFADRTYAEDGTLAPRSQPGAVLHESTACVAHVLSMVQHGGLRTATGNTLPTAFQSICVHGDNAGAVQTARAVADALRAQGHLLLSLPALLA